MNITPKRTEIVKNAVNELMEHGDLDFAGSYGEPGYGPSEKGIYFANWNDHEFLGNYLEALGYELEWSDEWYNDYENDKAYRSQADSYSWNSSILYCEKTHEMLTPDSDVTLWIDSVMDRTNIALPNWITDEQLIENDWVKVDEKFANDWYGNSDDPEAIAEALKENSVIESVLFKIEDTHQWGLKFSVFYKADSDD